MSKPDTHAAFEEQLKLAEAAYDAAKELSAACDALFGLHYNRSADDKFRRKLLKRFNAAKKQFDAIELGNTSV
jgi:hypothetical protein